MNDDFIDSIDLIDHRKVTMVTNVGTNHHPSTSSSANHLSINSNVHNKRVVFEVESNERKSSKTEPNRYFCV
ncbi:unnamed protein product [Medioppia subpectinata]|uniref:Uncharacterized protein n=1 Tax=Medioppia subpectinata TaxID=1979941 RepID=A0A7R9Q0R0_9ACAR|nr:unnamed protein product [Medioppia subpectinata]CAG2107801.1 unnamed protein product [Medioppia subpectinata]